MEKAIKHPIIFNMPKFGGKVTLQDCHNRMAFVFHNMKDIHDVVLDMDFDMHISEFYKGMIKGVHVMLEWYDGRNIDITRHNIDDILNTETMEEELYKGYLEAKETLMAEDEAYEEWVQELCDEQ